MNVTQSSLEAAGYSFIPTQIGPGLNCMDPGFARMLDNYVEEESTRMYFEAIEAQDEEAKRAIETEAARFQLLDSEVDDEISDILESSGPGCTRYDQVCASIQANTTRITVPEVSPETPLAAVENREERVLPRFVPPGAAPAEPAPAEAEGPAPNSYEAFRAEEDAYYAAEEARRAEAAAMQQTQALAAQGAPPAPNAQRADPCTMWGNPNPDCAPTSLPTGGAPTQPATQIDWQAELARRLAAERQEMQARGYYADPSYWERRERELEAEIRPEADRRAEAEFSASWAGFAERRQAMEEAAAPLGPTGYASPYPSMPQPPDDFQPRYPDPGVTSAERTEGKERECPFWWAKIGCWLAPRPLETSGEPTWPRVPPRQ